MPSAIAFSIAVQISVSILVASPVTLIVRVELLAVISTVLSPETYFPVYPHAKAHEERSKAAETKTFFAISSNYLVVIISLVFWLFLLLYIGGLVSLTFVKNVSLAFRLSLLSQMQDVDLLPFIFCFFILLFISDRWILVFVIPKILGLNGAQNYRI